MLRRDATSGERCSRRRRSHRARAAATVVVLSQSAYGQGTVHERGLSSLSCCPDRRARLGDTRLPRPRSTTGVVVASSVRLYMPVDRSRRVGRRR